MLSIVKFSLYKKMESMITVFQDIRKAKHRWRECANQFPIVVTKYLRKQFTRRTCLFVFMVSEASVHGKWTLLLQTCDEGRISRQWECVEEKANHFPEYTKSIKGGPKDETYLSKPYFCKLFYLLIVHQTITLSPSCSNHLSKYHPLATRTLTHEHLGILYIQTTTDGSVFELNILRNVN